MNQKEFPPLTWADTQNEMVRDMTKTYNEIYPNCNQCCYATGGLCGCTSTSRRIFCWILASIFGFFSCAFLIIGILIPLICLSSNRDWSFGSWIVIWIIFSLLSGCCICIGWKFPDGFRGEYQQI